MHTRFSKPELRDAVYDELPDMMNEEPLAPGMQLSLMPAVYERIEHCDEGFVMELWRVVAFLRVESNEPVLRLESTTPVEHGDTARTVTQAFGLDIVSTLFKVMEEGDDVN